MQILIQDARTHTHTHTHTNKQNEIRCIAEGRQTAYKLHITAFEDKTTPAEGDSYIGFVAGGEKKS